MMHLRGLIDRRKRWQAVDMRRLLVWFRVLFDAAYDFSYVPIAAVADVYERFGAAHWQSIFRALAAYRETVDFSNQRTTVYSLPFATCLAALCLDEYVHLAVGDAFCAGFDEAWRAFIAATDQLNEPADAGRWATLYSTAGQLGLLLAAAWPQQTLQRMAQVPLSAIAGERVCASLMHRQDIAGELSRLIVSPSAPMRDVLRDLALRHAPAMVVDATTGLAVAERVTRSTRSFKRCKEYLLAHYADSLPDSLRERLIDQVDLVPRGATPQAEASILCSLSCLAQVRGRFDLAEVDYVAAVRALSAGAEA
jgi:hypothetical protein